MSFILFKIYRKNTTHTVINTDKIIKRQKERYFCHMPLMGKPYKKILISSVVITLLLFAYDYFHDGGSKQPLTQTLIDVAIFGTLYVILIFAVASGLYFLASRLSR